MRSTFMGLETAKRGMFTQQTALYTTGHNIANANTPGYTRQRVNFVQTNPYPNVSLTRPNYPGQLGTGVEAGTITRIRDQFLDKQFRAENNKIGYWGARNDVMKQMEEIMNEPTKQGLANQFDQFWNALQDLSTEPNDSGARGVVVERGKTLAETFNYVYDSLKSVQSDYYEQISVTEKEINSILRQINNVNQQIGEVEPHGYLPNDLYDERDRLIDELSSFLNVEVEPVPSGGNALAIADGKYNIFLVDSQGNRIQDSGGNDIQLLSAAGVANGIKINFDSTTNAVSTITFHKLDGSGGFVDSSVTDFEIASFADFTSPGEVQAFISSYGYNDGAEVKGEFPEIFHKLDTMAYVFAKEFNNVHANGWTKNQILGNDAYDPANDPVYFFWDSATGFSDDPSSISGFASRIRLSDDVIESADNVAAAYDADDPTQKPDLGDGNNAWRLSEVKNNTYNFDGLNTNLQSYYQGIIGDLGVDAAEAERFMKNSTTLQEAVGKRRASVMSVSLDEEMMNMIKFQHAYNASARNITMIDEMLDKIINGMGVVGR